MSRSRVPEASLKAEPVQQMLVIALHSVQPLPPDGQVEKPLKLVHDPMPAPPPLESPLTH